MSGTQELVQLRELLETGSDADVRRFFHETPPHEIAELSAQLVDSDVWRLLMRARPHEAAAVFCRLPLSRQARLAEDHPASEVTQVLSAMAPDDRADLIKQLDPQRQGVLLGLLSEAQRRETQRLAEYPEGTVGAVMNTEFCAIPSDLTADDALNFLRTMMPLREELTSVFVLDEAGQLVGVLSLQSLIMARPETPVTELMRPDPVSVRADESREVAAALVQQHDLLALPVLDDAGRMVGVVTVDDVLDVQQEESTADFHKMGTVGLVNVHLKEAPLTLLVRARIPWLLALVFMNIFSGAGIAYFEETLSAMISLAFFLPLLIDSGGNAGSQSATLMVRALATGDVRLSDWVKLLGRELIVAVVLGVIMAGGVALIAGFRAPDIVPIVAMTMVLVVTFGSVVGMSLPFLFTRLKMDPATASAPLITSIADIGGVLIYFSIATWWLGDKINAVRSAAGG
ncbi:MAG: magnesium transporter [Tepidisphaerales bacterium]